MRIKRGTTRRAKHNKVLRRAKGFVGRRNSVYVLAKEGIQKAGVYAYRDRKNKKRVMRALWIVRLNAAVRAAGINYSTFIKKLNDNNITINRRILSDLAINNKEAFAKVLEQIK